MRFYIDPASAGGRGWGWGGVVLLLLFSQIQSLLRCLYFEPHNNRQHAGKQVPVQKYTGVDEEHSLSIYNPPLYSWVSLKLWEGKSFSFLGRRTEPYFIPHNIKAGLM